MITRLEVDGFKSLRDFAIDFEPFTVLIGPNSAGKSNVLEALALLSRLAEQPIVEAFKGGRGKSIDQFTRHGGEVATRIRFAVELLLSYWRGTFDTEDINDQSRFRYELTIARQPVRGGVERLIVEDESLLAIRREGDTWIEAHPELEGFAGYMETGAGSRDLLSLAERPPNELSPRTALSEAIASTSFDAQMSLARCRVLHLGAEGIGRPSERFDSRWLAPDASNLPTVLASLAPEVLGQIRADLVSLVPGIASFDVAAKGDDVDIDFELTGGERLPGRLVSAGTLRALALLTSLSAEPSPHTLCIEEPENGIYPGRLLSLLALLKKATALVGTSVDRRARIERALELLHRVRNEDNRNRVSVFAHLIPTQIILTTHSPIVLSALRDEPHHLRFVDMVRSNGARISRVRRVGETSGRTSISLSEIDLLLKTTEIEGLL